MSHLAFVTRTATLNIPTEDRFILNLAHACACEGKVDMGFAHLQTLRDGYGPLRGCEIPALHTQVMLNITIERITTHLEGINA